MDGWVGRRGPSLLDYFDIYKAPYSMTSLTRNIGSC